MAVALLGSVVLASVSFLPAAAFAKAGPEAPSFPPSTSFSLAPLSPADGKAYAAAFAAIRSGDFQAADAQARKVSDPLLLGRLGFAKLMHPAYRASYEELSDWLQRYSDLPDADRVYALARKRKPAAAPAPTAPKATSDGDAAIWARVENLASRFEAARPTPVALKKPTTPTKAKADEGEQAARDAYYAGDVEKAYTLAVQSGETWIAGLAAFRLGRYEEAKGLFAMLAEDETKDEWIRSGAGYWAARAAIADGDPEAAPHFLTLAARTPYTFYGLIAERQLGLDPGVTAAGIDPAVAAGPRPARPATVAGAAGGAVAMLVETDAQARRAAGLAQLGMKTEAGAELRTGLMRASGEARQTWMRLGLALNAPLTSSSDLARRPARQRFDIAQYPTPELTPDGGFTLDKALVYALVRQESRFNPTASSAAGAYGLMQLMPATAARVSGDSKLRADPSRLKEPGFNLRLGQDYVARLLTALDGDLLHAVAAYNSGPGVIQKTVAQLGRDADSLLAIESMPGAQTREFVEKVVAGYWIYRNIFGHDSPTLDAAASGRRAVAMALDQTTNLTAAQIGGEALLSLFKAPTN